jgi:hypothetical protein
MLRALVALLLVANLAFFGWSQGWLDGVVGVKAHGDREPERLARQVNPDRIVILSAANAVLPATQMACLEAGPFTPAEAAAAEAALQGLAPAGSWTNVRTEKPGTWLVYMGSYSDREALRRKEEEIRRVRAEFEEVSLPGEGEFGLSLGRFEDRALAERALIQVQQRGIRTARVVQASPTTVFHMLRIERADPALTTQLTSAKADALGKGFYACARADAFQR